MLRIVNLCLLLALVGFAGVIYQVKYDARGVDGGLTQLAEQIEKERESIAILKAELSLLSRPDRIERLARKHLSLDYAQARQLIGLDGLDAIMTPDPALLQAGAPPDPQHTASIRKAGKAQQHD